jgi:cysteine desulfurase
MTSYLDHNATSPLKGPVHAAFVAALGLYGNPSSTHGPGRDSRMALDGARRQVAGLVACRPEQVVFTSGGTEANNLALRGVMSLHRGERLLVSVVEHSCVLNTARALAAQQGVPVTPLAVDAAGRIDLPALEAELAKGNVGLVSVMHANNETGVVNPVAEVAALCRRFGVPYHVDAVQSGGKLPLNFPQLGASLLTLSFHKMGGPKGVGALVVDPKIDMNALFTGGGQERNRRAGTENLPGIVAAGVAAELSADLSDLPRQAALRQRLEKGLKTLANDLTIVGETAERLPNTCNFITPGLDSETAVMALDIDGVAVSSGAACSSGRVEPSHVLMALGYSRAMATCGLRVSFGWSSTDTDVDNFLTAYGRLVRRQRLQ